MSTPLHKTKGLVLRTVKYGETSLVVTVFTELFGLQSYMVNGVRTVSKKGGGKAQLFQPAALLELVVYHNEFKQLNRIREQQWHHIYRQVFADVPKNSVALFMMELLAKCLKQPESNAELFAFVEDVLMHLDKSEGTVMANLPLFFALHLSEFFGFRLDDNYSSKRNILDLQEGCFIDHIPGHPFFLDERQSAVVAQLLKVMQARELDDIKLHSDFRRDLLLQLEKYYAFHIPEFGSLKTLQVLKAIF